MTFFRRFGVAPAPVPHLPAPTTMLPLWGRRPRGSGATLAVALGGLLSLGPLVSLSALLALSGCKGEAKADAATEAKTVRVQAVGREDVEDVLSYPADLKPSAEVRVYSRMADRILSFPWKNGDEIKRGSRLAIIRAGGLSEGIAQVGAQMDALDAQIENQHADLGRAKKLLDSGSIAQAEYERMSATLRASQAQRRALAAGQGQLAATASDGTILAPISGIVADKRLIEGDMASPGAALCRIIAVEQLKMELRLVEADVPKVRTGQPVQLFLDAYPGRAFAGVVSAVLPYLDQQTRTNTVEVSVENPKDAESGERPLKPGMFGRAELLVSRRTAVLAAPEPALLLDNRVLERQKPGETLRKAFVVDHEGVARQRSVRLGARTGTLLEVLEGLAEGERLVVRGQHGLRDGQRVQVVEPAKP